MTPDEIASIVGRKPVAKPAEETDHDQAVVLVENPSQTPTEATKQQQPGFWKRLFGLKG